MTLNQIAYMILAVIAWPTLFGIAKRVQKTSGVTIQTVGFSICFAITTTLQISIVYNGLANITGINNIGWLLGYALGCLGIFLSVDGFYKAQDLQTPSYLATALILCLSIILFTSPAIAAEPNYLNHNQPTNIAQWLLMGGTYAYGLLVTTTIALNFNGLRRIETLYLTKFRWSILVFSSTSAAIFFTGRLLHFAFGSLAPAWQAGQIWQFIYTITNSCFFIGSVWVLFFLPQPYLEKIATPFYIWRKVRSLQALLRVQKSVNHFCPVVVAMKYNWLDRLRNLDFHIYNTVIIILDGKVSLRDALDGNTSLVRKDHWDRTRAERLHQLLQTVHDENAFDELVTEYRRLGKQCQHVVFADQLA